MELYLYYMLEQLLDKRSIKPTTMRLLVLLQLIQATAALSLKELEGKFERADKATLFRTLKTFEEKKLIHKIDDGTGSVKYALCAETCECEPQDQHMHFHCHKCGYTSCLQDSSVRISGIPKGYVVQSANLVLQGICDQCARG